MEEKSLKKKQKRQIVDEEQLEEVDEVLHGEVSEEKEEKTKSAKAVKAKKVKEKKQKKEVEDEKEDEEPKKKSKWWVALIVVVLVLVAGAFAAKAILLKTSVKTDTIKVSDDARGFSNYFKEYLKDRIEAEKIINAEFEKLDEDATLKTLSSLKDGFSKVSRGMSGNYTKSVYTEAAEAMGSDSSLFLTAVRELRNIFTDDDSDAVKKEAFDKKVAEIKEGLRSAVYVATGAFNGDVTGLSSKSVLSFEGGALVEAGGGVMNIFVGNFKDGIVAVSSDLVDEKVKAIDAQKLYGYNGVRVLVIGDSLDSELESGWYKNIKLEVGSLEAKMTKTKVSLVLKSFAGLEKELGELGVKGLVDKSETTEIEKLTEAVAEIKGKK